MTILSLKYIGGWSYEHLRKYLSHIILFLSLVMIVLNLYQVNDIQRIIDAALQKQCFFVIHTIFGFIFISLARMLRNFLFVNISKDHIITFAMWFLFAGRREYIFMRT